MLARAGAAAASSLPLASFPAACRARASAPAALVSLRAFASSPAAASERAPSIAFRFGRRGSSVPPPPPLPRAPASASASAAAPAAAVAAPHAAPLPPSRGAAWESLPPSYGRTPLSAAEAAAIMSGGAY